MKTIFYTTDPNFQSVYSTFEGEDAHLCGSFNDLDGLIDNFMPSVLLVDFDDDELKCLDVVKKYASKENTYVVLITGSLELAEIQEIQNSDSSCDAYLTKPVSKEILEEVIGDFKISMGLSKPAGEDSVVKELDESLVFDVSQLKEELKNNKIEEATSETVDMVDESDETGEVEEFPSSDMNEMKISTEVRTILNDHNNSEVFYDDEVNQDIQRKFDTVFGDIEQSAEQPTQEDSAPLDLREEVQATEEEGISFDLSSDDELEKNELGPVEDNKDVEEVSSNEVSMSDDNDEVGGLEFNLPEEEASSEQSVSEDNTETVSEDIESEEDGLSFDVSEELDLGAQEEPVPEEDASEGLSFEMNDGEDEQVEQVADTEEDDGGLDFSVEEDEGEGLALSAEGDETPAAEATEEKEEEGGLEFDSMDGDLALGEGDEPVENSVVEEPQDDGIVFDDDEGGLSLSEEGDEIDNHVPEDSSGPGDLDLSAGEEKDDDDDEAEMVDHASIETTDSFQLGESDDIDATISSIVAAPEDSTGEFDMSEVEESAPVSAVESSSEEDHGMEEFDYKTSSGFTADLDAVSGENTNPTIIAQTGTLKEGDLLSDIEEESTVTEENINNELSFSETIENDSIVNEFNNEAATQTVQTPSENVVSKRQMTSKEEYESLRNYDEDEMLRLQGTIRQLREEREELMGQIQGLKSEKQLLEQDNLGLKAELDEVKIELGIVKKRHHDEISEKEYHYKLNEDKKELYETKAKTLQKEFDRLNQKVRIDFNQVKQREKELESKLELTVMDSESQVQTRDMKILELKRKIDSLEFNMENSSIRELKHREDKSKLEERLAKIMKTLRGSIQLIEDDLDELETDNTKELD